MAQLLTEKQEENMKRKNTSNELSRISNEITSIRKRSVIIKTIEVEVLRKQLIYIYICLDN